MSRRSGKYSYVDGMSCIGSWNVSQGSSASRYAASCAPGGTVATDGNENWSGSINGYGYLPPMPTEDSIPFIGVVSAQDGQIVNEEGEILITDSTITIPVNAGGPITWTANFGVQGELTKTTAEAYIDMSREPGPSAKLGKISIESVLASNTFTDIDDVQNIVLTFRRPAVESVNDGLTYRESGNLECDLNFQVDSDDLHVAIYAVGANRRVRVYVTDTLFYLLDAIKFTEKSNFQVQRDPLAMVGYQVNGMWSALIPRTPAALGQILLPGGDPLYEEIET